MTPNKGIPAILWAVSSVAPRHPSVRLILKGLDSWFHSNRHIEAMTRNFPADELATLARRVAYVGGTLSFREVARYYQAADAYVAPYSGEGFNLPVLEAIACGLPVICTAGGPTDDFTTEAFALRIDSRLMHGTDPQDRQTHFLAPDPQHLVELMSRVLEDRDWMAQARQAGPAFVADGYTWRSVVDRLLTVVLGEER
jgi:glycosyltransferase involved in cell wall biosynthesis